MNKSVLFAAAAFAGLSLYPSQAPADDWGCQVLLCVSGNWQGTPSCHPPMYKLIAAMKLPGFSWPICPSAQSKGAKHEPYEDCPSGWIPDTEENQSTGNSGRTSSLSICKRSFSSCGRTAKNAAKDAIGEGIETKEVYSTGNGSQCSLVQTQPRKLREKPYYIEYTDAKGLRQRAWFNLNL